jgi:hypothetical protein
VNTPTVAIINVYGHTFHTNVRCPIIQRHKHAVRFMPQREATLYFGMVNCDRCRKMDAA